MATVSDLPAAEHERVSDIPRSGEVRLLFGVAAIIFTATVVIGLINGQKLIRLSSDVLLTHVHAGTLGWITLGVFALSLWLFSAGSARAQPDRPARWLSVAAVIVIPCYIGAFLSGNLIARATFGVPALLVIAGFFVWAIARATRGPLTVARLAVLGGFLTLTTGALLGVLLQFVFATGRMFLPPGAFSAHPGALVTGYLALVGMAISEWRLRPTHTNFRLGVTQISLFFASGLLLLVALLLDITPLLAINTLLLLAGVIIYLWRFGARLTSAGWLTRGAERHFAASAVYLVLNIGLTISLAVGLVANLYTPANLPEGLLLAMDHTMFIGVMTNALLGLIQEAIRERGVLRGWVSGAIFWCVNLGLAGFAVGLITQQVTLYRLFTPLMGAGLLLAIVVYAWLLLRPAQRAMPARG